MSQFLVHSLSNWSALHPHQFYRPWHIKSCSIFKPCRPIDVVLHISCLVCCTNIYSAVTETQKESGDYAEVPSFTSPEPVSLLLNLFSPVNTNGVIQQEEVLSERSSSPSENRSLPPTSPQQVTSNSQVTSPNPVDPYARVDVAKKAYERQKKAELERRWRLNSGMYMSTTR